LAGKRFSSRAIKQRISPLIFEPIGGLRKRKKIQHWTGEEALLDSVM